MRTSVILAAAIVCGSAHAKCISNDAWTGPDKTKHFAVGVALGSAGVLAFNEPHKAFLVGAGIGLAKELYDRRGGGTCSAQDFAVTALGAAAGAYGTAWIVTPNFVGYARRF
jgi:putative lipoprotein